MRSEVSSGGNGKRYPAPTHQLNDTGRTSRPTLLRCGEMYVFVGDYFDQCSHAQP